MKIWKAFYRTPDSNEVSWHATKAEAVTWMKELKQDAGAAQGPAGIALIDFPEDRAGFIAWLNTHFNTDNG